MKNKIIQTVKWVQENQNGLFKVAILIILLYWTTIFQSISNNNVDVSGIESELSDIVRKLSDIDSTLSTR